MKSYICTRCDWEWIPRTDKPKNCPGCHSPYWDKPRVREYYPPKDKEVKTDVRYGCEKCGKTFKTAREWLNHRNLFCSSTRIRILRGQK